MLETKGGVEPPRIKSFVKYVSKKKLANYKQPIKTYYLTFLAWSNLHELHSGWSKSNNLNNMKKT